MSEPLSAESAQSLGLQMSVPTEEDSRTALYALGAYTKLDAARMKLILGFYQLDSTEHYTHHQELMGGLSNSNYALYTTHRTLLCKVCDNKTLREIKQQILALIKLQEQNNPHILIAYPIRQTHAVTQSREGEEGEEDVDVDAYVLCLSGLSPLVVYEFLPGVPPRLPTVSIMQQLAHTLAAVHSVHGQRFTFLPPFPMGVSEMQPFIQEELPTLPLHIQQHPFIDFLIHTLKELLPSLTHPSLPAPGVLHGDLFLENCIITETENNETPRLLGVIDWEEMCLGPCLLDVCMTIVGCCYNTKDELNISITQAFLHAYQQVRALTTLEQSLLPDFLAYACLSIGFWRFRQFNVRSPNEQRKDSYKSMQSRIETIDREGLIKLAKYP